MSVLVLMILNFSTDTAEGNFSLPINVVLSVVSVGVYTIFLVNQMGPYRCFFMDPSERLARQVAGAGNDGISQRP